MRGARRCGRSTMGSVRNIAARRWHWHRLADGCNGRWRLWLAVAAAFIAVAIAAGTGANHCSAARTVGVAVATLAAAGPRTKLGLRIILAWPAVIPTAPVGPVHVDVQVGLSIVAAGAGQTAQDTLVVLQI